MASALFKKFQDEQAKKDAEYKAWEEDQWKQHGTEWTKEGYTRTVDSNKAWGSTWAKKQTTPKNENINLADYFDLQTSITNTIQGINNLELPSSGIQNGFGLFGQGSNPLSVKGTVITTPATEEKPQYASYKDIMKQPWARYGYFGVNRGYVDENGQFIANPEKYTGKKFQTFVTRNLYGGGDNSHNDVTYAYDQETGNIRAMSENKFGHAKGWATAEDEGAVNNGGWGSLSDMLAQYGITYKKQGGTMNKVKYFAQGGQPQTQNDVQRQVEALVEAALAGDQKATQQVNQIMQAAKQGNQQAAQLAQMIQVAAQKLQGQVTSAKWGSKLQYIRSLKFAKGGKTCPECTKDDGKTVKVAKKDIDKETYQRLSPEQQTEADIHYGTATSTNKDGSYNISHKPSAQDSTHISRKLMSKSMSKNYPEKKKCGGRARKHEGGGDFYYNETTPMRMSNGRRVVGIVNREIVKDPSNRGISQTIYNGSGEPVVQKDKTFNGGEREIYYNVTKPVKRRKFLGPRYEMANDTVYLAGDPEMFQNFPNMSTPEKQGQASRFAQGI